MADVDAISQFVVGAVTVAASREAAIRAEVLKVGDPVRVLVKASYGDPKVHTGVIVGFEPFKELPTVIVAYIENEWNKSELKILAYSDKTKDIELIAAPPNVNIDIERSRVLDYFNTEERKKLAEIDELKAKRAYFDRYFGKFFSELPPPAAEPEMIEA
jgi:hypothetical protein